MLKEIFSKFKKDSREEVSKESLVDEYIKIQKMVDLQGGTLGIKDDKLRRSTKVELLGLAIVYNSSKRKSKMSSLDALDALSDNISYSANMSVLDSIAKLEEHGLKKALDDNEDKLIHAKSYYSWIKDSLMQGFSQSLESASKSEVEELKRYLEEESVYARSGISEGSIENYSKDRKKFDLLKQGAQNPKFTQDQRASISSELSQVADRLEAEMDGIAYCSAKVMLEEVVLDKVNTRLQGTSKTQTNFGVRR